MSQQTNPRVIGGFVLIVALGIFMPLWNLGQAARGGA